MLAAGDVHRMTPVLLQHALVSLHMTGRAVDGIYWCDYMVEKHGFKQLVKNLDPR